MPILFEPFLGNTLVARGPTNLGLYVFKQSDVARAIVIDSGGDEDAGRKILRECERLGVELAMIINTHSNADHCGGNAFLSKRTGCSIAATELEAAFLSYPQLEPSFLSGSFPQKALRNKFLMAQPSRANCLLEPPCALTFDKDGRWQLSKPAQAHGSAAANAPQGSPINELQSASTFAPWSGLTSASAIIPKNESQSAAQGMPCLQIMSLPGHYFSMIGILTPDNVFFVADSLAGAPILEKYGLFFLYDIEAELATLSMLESSEAEWFVPAHAEPTQDIKSLVDINRAKIFEIADVIVSAVNSEANCAEGATLENVMAAVFSHYNIVLNANQYVLVGSTIRSYLFWLCDQGKLENAFEHQRMIFRIKR
ncbi:MAG TPA: MBL fold metallo-hydrolase [Rectinema sp.]|nr:MBL fold metallo-hydrolase [Rectinema sp.]